MRYITSSLAVLACAACLLWSEASNAQCTSCGEGPAVASGGCDSCGGAATCGRCHKGCVNPLSWFGRLLGMSVPCGGCDKEVYYGDWISDPPDCHDPCNCHGQYTGARGATCTSHLQRCAARGGCESCGNGIAAVETAAPPPGCNCAKTSYNAPTYASRSTPATSYASRPTPAPAATAARPSVPAYRTSGTSYGSASAAARSAATTYRQGSSVSRAAAMDYGHRSPADMAPRILSVTDRVVTPAESASSVASGPSPVER